MTDQLNQLGHTAHEKGGLAELRRIEADESEPLPRRAAAKMWIRNLCDGFSKAGKPLAGDDLDRTWDRTVGKAPQQLIVQHQPAEKPAALADDLVGLLDQQPELVDQVWPRLLRGRRSTLATVIDDWPTVPVAVKARNLGIIERAATIRQEEVNFRLRCT
ncbi:MAG: hypothetical protein V3U29_02035 [Phycisphaeraceae bacterium]